MALYHMTLGFPKTLNLPTHRFPLLYSRHAQNASKNDRYGDFSHLLVFHTHLDPRSATIIEIETNDATSQVVKVVYRLPLAPGNDFDVCFAVMMLPNGGRLVKTCWLNEKGDKHQTLKQGRYSRP